MDEPSYKSTFGVTLVRPKGDGYVAYSNMPEEVNPCQLTNLFSIYIFSVHLDIRFTCLLFHNNHSSTGNVKK